MTDLLLSMIFSFIGIGLVVGLLLWRSKTGNRIEIKPTDIIIAVIPILVFFVATGKLTKAVIPGVIEFEVTDIVPPKLTFSETGITVEESWKNGEIDKSISLEKLIETNIMACPLELNYTEEFVKAYLNFFPALRYIIITDKNGDFVGICEAPKLLLYFFPTGNIYERPQAPMISDKNQNAVQKKELNYIENLFDQERNRRLESFVSALKEGSLDYFRDLKGFVSKKHAINPTHHVLEAFQKMEKFHLNFLPVINEKNEFKGIVERSDILAALLMDITKSLENR